MKIELMTFKDGRGSSQTWQNVQSVSIHKSIVTLTMQEGRKKNISDLVFLAVDNEVWIKKEA